MTRQNHHSMSKFSATPFAISEITFHGATGNRIITAVPGNDYDRSGDFGWHCLREQRYTPETRHLFQWTLHVHFFPKNDLVIFNYVSIYTQNQLESRRLSLDALNDSQEMDFETWSILVDLKLFGHETAFSRIQPPL